MIGTLAHPFPVRNFEFNSEEPPWRYGVRVRQKFNRSRSLLPLVAGPRWYGLAIHLNRRCYAFTLLLRDGLQFP
jgi:hypothetical protein